MKLKFQGTKYVQVQSTETLEALLNSLSEMLFGTKQPFLVHVLKKKLGSDLRKNLRRNINDEDVIIYTDFSKGSKNYD